jgi:hypothetical protein
VAFGFREPAAGHRQRAAGAGQVPVGDRLAELAGDAGQFVKIGIGGVECTQLAAALDPPQATPQCGPWVGVLGGEGEHAPGRCHAIADSVRSSARHLAGPQRAHQGRSGGRRLGQAEGLQAERPSLIGAGRGQG